MGKKKNQKYKIRLTSGRVLGPIDLERVRELLIKNRFTGEENARVYPNGEWLTITQIPEINELFMAHLEGRLKSDTPLSEVGSSSKEVHHPVGDSLETVILSESGASSEAGYLPGAESEDGSSSTNASSSLKNSKNGSDSLTSGEAEEPTAIQTKNFDREDYEKTVMSNYEAFDEEDFSEVSQGFQPPALASQETVLFERAPSQVVSRYEKKSGSLTRFFLWGLVIFWMGIEFFWTGPSDDLELNLEKIKPRMPVFLDEKADPEKSKKLMAEGVRFYVKDHVEGYAKAAQKFQLAASYDSSNLKALALLASTYLNLIDSSSQDENYFSIIKKLIELSSSKEFDLPEAVIADVEFFLTINRAESARSRIIEYTKTHQKFGLEMLYYMAAVFAARGETIKALRYVRQIPNKDLFSPKILYLKGQLLEKINSAQSAAKEYQAALKLFPNHAKSRLAIIELLADRGELSSGKTQLKFLLDRPKLLSPFDLSKVFYYDGRLKLIEKNESAALKSFKQAVDLNPQNHKYLLEYYSVRGQHSDDPELKATAKMYYHLSEGEQFLQKDQYQEALNEFLKARNANLKSALPLEKIGDTFMLMEDIRNAKMNYEKAAELQPEQISIWSKFIHVLIESYEWEATKNAMAKFRSNPEAKSTIDKLAGDLYAKQGIAQQALIYYRRAMSRKTIDPEVYIAYANGLLALNNCRDAPFFFALARRYDRNNAKATLGIAQCIAKEESPNRAIIMLEDELQKSASNRAQILSQIAKFQVQMGDYRSAKRTIEEAKRANRNLGLPFKIEAELILSANELDPKVFRKALRAYESYVERNPSDADAFVDQYKIYIQLTEFEKAGEALDQVYARYPKYPNLHYFRGELYALMGNRKEAQREFQLELEKNPSNVNAMVALGKQMLTIEAYHDALKYFNQAMQFAPTAASPKAMAGYANYLLENYYGAIALYRAALKIDEADPLVYKRLGLAYQALGDGTNASKAFQKYLEVAPDAPDRKEIERFL